MIAPPIFGPVVPNMSEIFGLPLQRSVPLGWSPQQTKAKPWIMAAIGYGCLKKALNQFLCASLLKAVSWSFVKEEGSIWSYRVLLPSLKGLFVAWKESFIA